MKRKYTIEEIKEAINEAQLKIIDKFDKELEESKNKLSSTTKMALQMQNMMTIVKFEIELIKELEGK